MSKTQHIICVDSDIFKHRINGLQSYVPSGKDIVIARRLELEYDDRYRQLLPINIFLSHDEKKIWAYQRTPSGNEQRLHGKTAVAVGGHWDLADISHNNSIIDFEISLQNAIIREQQEEVNIIGNITQSYLADYVICADETEVDRKHVALVYINVMSKSAEISSKEPDLLSLGFIDLELLFTFPNNETWTTKILEILKD